MLKSFFNWKVLLNLVLAAAIFAGLVWLTFRWLEYHTNHGKEIPVPNVVNMSVHKAIEVLDDAGLTYEVDSFKYDPKYRPFQVLQIYPYAGSRVKGGRSIVMKVNPRTWAKIQIPDILDRYKGLAFRQLDQVGLKVGDTIFEPNIQRDAVIRMQMNGVVLKPGAFVPRFSTIDLVIGTGPKRNVTVPNLVGLTVQEAEAIIAQNLFEVGLVEHEDGGKDKSDIVYYQDPEGGAIRDQGMQIDLWASKRTPAEMGSKISELNATYRVAIDTSLAPIQYEEVPVYNEPVPAPVQKEVVKPKAQPKPVEKPKPTTTTTKPATTKKPSTNTSGSGTKATTTTTAKSTSSGTSQPAKTEEKPKVKKVVVE